MEEMQLEMLKIWNSDPEDICAVEMEENKTLLDVETKVLSSAEHLKHTQISQIRPESPQSVMADHVVEEFKKAVKTCVGCPTKATIKTTLITLLMGVLPSSFDLFSDFNLGLSCIMKGDYSWGGKECLHYLISKKYESVYNMFQTQGSQACYTIYVVNMQLIFNLTGTPKD